MTLAQGRTRVLTAAGTTEDLPVAEAAWLRTVSHRSFRALRIADDRYVIAAIDREGGSSNLEVVDMRRIGSDWQAHSTSVVSQLRTAERSWSGMESGLPISPIDSEGGLRLLVCGGGSVEDPLSPTLVHYAPGIYEMRLSMPIGGATGRQHLPAADCQLVSVGSDLQGVTGRDPACFVTRVRDEAEDPSPDVKDRLPLRFHERMATGSYRILETPRLHTSGEYRVVGHGSGGFRVVAVRAVASDAPGTWVVMDASWDGDPETPWHVRETEVKGIVATPHFPVFWQQANDQFHPWITTAVGMAVPLRGDPK